MLLDKSFWNYRWENRLTGWDIGYASPAIARYLDQYPNRDAAVLIPGCGNAHEAIYLIELGFSNINLLDIAPKAVQILEQKFEKYPQVKVFGEDFFDHQGCYDLIIEQTFFCTMPLERRSEYVKKMVSLLNNQGKIVGLLFDKIFEHQGPPFGGTAAEYSTLFEPYFELKTLSSCYNSITPREKSELFVNFIKKPN